jgi:DNA (cytosine-5)-methyltransferase 1
MAGNDRMPAVAEERLRAVGVLGEEEHTLTSDGSDGSDGSEDGTGRGTPVVNVTSASLTDDAPVVRRLTPTECERLQGFLDGWTDIPGASDSARYRQLGNAETVNVVEWIAHRIVAVESGLL